MTLSVWNYIHTSHHYITLVHWPWNLWKGTLNLPSTLLQQFHTSKFSFYSSAHFRDRTYGYTRYIHIYLFTRTHDTNLSFEPIFMKFTWLVRVHPWMIPIVSENNQPCRTTDIRENVAPKPGFQLSFSRFGFFWEKNIKTIFGSPFSHRKSFFVLQRPTP